MRTLTSAQRTAIRILFCAEVAIGCAANPPAEAPSTAKTTPSCDSGDLDDCQARCEIEPATGCVSLGRIYAEEAGGHLDSRLAAEAFEKACNAGQLEGCHEAGNIWVLVRPDIERDFDKGYTLHERACRGGITKSCTRLGVMHDNGDGRESDPKKANILFEQACDAGELVACGNWAGNLENGRGCEKDQEKAIKLYKQACDSRVPIACMSLSSAFDEGNGVDKNPEQATKLMVRACELGEPWACRYSGYRFQEGIGTKVDVAAAADFYSKACEAEDEEACNALKDLSQ